METICRNVSMFFCQFMMRTEMRGCRIYISKTKKNIDRLDFTSAQLERKMKQTHENCIL